MLRGYNAAEKLDEDEGQASNKGGLVEENECMGRGKGERIVKISSGWIERRYTLYIPIFLH